MFGKSSLLMQLSNELGELAESARACVTEVRGAEGHRLTGVLWTPNAVVVSEQALPEASEFDVTIGGRSVKARLRGRDPGTNVALLALDSEFAEALPSPASVRVGSLALVLGMGRNGLSARLAAVRSVGGAWESQSGGTIDQRITLDAPLDPNDEGGPVLAADGRILGVAARGSHGQSLVIPASTVGKAVATLLANGGIERGWLGLSLRPVALPDALKPKESQHVGLMVMEVSAGSPAAKADILAGDIVLSAGGVPATRFGKISRQLGSASVGKTIEITLARGGAIVTREATITARTV
jgi:S1-C subfamily serine protease